MSEGIDWTRVEFEDNQECLELFDKRPLGLISLLDEECTFPKGTDYTFADKLKEHLNGKICFKAERGRAFCIRHYAGEVTYDTLGFLEKNKDLLHSDLLQILASCGTALPQLFSVKIEQGLQKLISPVRRSGTESQKQSVATKFKEQLSRLMQKLENTEPHFIRCIKPNTLQQPNLYEEDLVLQQLRCCGVLEVVRISRSGYPTRVSHQKFASRYGFLHPQYSTSQKDVLNICVAILHQFGVPPEMYQVGYTKLFLRAGQIGRMEDCRLQTLHGIIYFQKLYRGYRTRCCFRTLKRATLLLQSLVRGRKVRKEFDIRRKKHRAAMVIQRFIRCRAERKAYLRIREKVLVIQLVARGWLARKKRLALQSQVEHESSRQKGLGSEAPRKMRETLVSEGPTYNTSGLEAKDTNFMVTEVMHKEAEATAIVSPSFLAKLKSRALYAEAALREKEVDNAFLHQRLNQYETRWSEYEANISYLEEMWQMQMTSLQLSLTAAKKSLASQGPSSQALKYDGIFPVKSGVTKQRATQHILPHDDDDDDDNDNDFNWDENTSVETKTPDNSLTPRKAPSDISLTRRDLDAGQSVISHLAKEFEHCKQVFMDDAEFLMEVKSGQTEASLNPDDELRKLKQRFNAWKKDFKCRLRGTKYVLQKLGNGDSAQKMKKNWWRKRKVQLQYRGVVI